MQRDLTTADSSAFYACRNPGKYALNYKSFYDRALDRRSFLNSNIARVMDGAADENVAKQGFLLDRAVQEAEGAATLMRLGETNHIATAEAFSDLFSPLFQAAEDIVFARP